MSIGNFEFWTPSFQRETVQQFLTIYGPFLESLYIVLRSEDDKSPLSFPMVDFAQLLQLGRLQKLYIIIEGRVRGQQHFWTETIPDNVQALTLREFSLSTYGQHDDFIISRQFFHSLFHTAPNLESIFIDRRVKANDFLNDLASIPVQQNLKYIDLDGISQADLRVLLQLGTRAQNPLRLDRFCIKEMFGPRGPETTEILKSFLESQTQSLSWLTIFDGSYQKTEIVLPPLLELQKLVLVLRDDINLRFESFAVTFPKLKNLHYEQQYKIIWEEDPILMRLATEKPTILTRLSLREGLNSRTSLENLGKTFCGLQELKLTLENPTLLTAIWTTCQTLKDLNLEIVNLSENEKRVFTSHVDLSSLISGIPEEIHKHLLDLISKGQKPEPLEKVKSMPGIGDLKGNIANQAIGFRIYSHKKALISFSF